MATKRVFPRARRRCRVVIGGSTFFTSDVSAGGLAVDSTSPIAPGGSVSGTIGLDGEEFAFTALVKWAKPGDSQLMLRGRFGMKFLGVAEGFFQALAKPSFAVTGTAPPSAARHGAAAPTGQTKRRHRRARCAAPVLVESSAGPVVGRCENISLGGLLVRAPALPLGTQVRCRVRLPATGEITATGEVCRHELNGAVQMGIRLIEIAPEQLLSLHRFVATA